jgi:hypothetical protein
VLDLLYGAPNCDPVPGELDRLATEAVFTQPPSTATPRGEPENWQPCDLDESDYTGGRSVSYASTLTNEQVAEYYRTLTRKSKWRARPDESIDQVRLVFAVKWTRERCLWLSVFRSLDNTPGLYAVEIQYWTKYARSYCA